MKQISNKEYEKYQKYQTDKLHGRILTPDGLRVVCAGHHARQMTKYDYEYYDLIICMDHANVRNAQRITGGDPENKIRLLLDDSDRPGEEVADPWYTGNFDATWRDVTEGCAALIEQTAGSAAAKKDNTTWRR